MRSALCALVLSAAFLSFGEIPAHAASASLYVAPSTGTFTVGSTFTVSLYVNTGGEAVNAIQADLKFPPDMLQVVSPSTGKSLIQVWIGQPGYSNSDGTLHFQGTVPHPGITADAGLISTITFRVMKTGTAQLRFLDTSRVLLDDGKGTDFLGQTTDGVYTFALPPPAGPLVTSPTTPDQTKWYQTRNLVFEWASSGSADGYSYVLNQNPIDDPDNVSEGTGTSVSYQNLPDGTYYFHIKALRNGVWGGVTLYEAQIDNTPPASFTPTVSPDVYTSNQTPVIYFETTDAASGIDHYELKFIPLDAPVAQSDNAPFFIEASSPYSRKLDYGRYDLVVRAYDAAGNYYQSITRVTVAPPTFQLLRSGGIYIGGNFTIPWVYVIVIGLILIVFLGWLGRRAWIWHRQVEEYVRHGAMAEPRIFEKVKLLQEKQGEYQNKNGGGQNAPPAGPAAHVIAFLFAAAVSALLVGHQMARAQVPSQIPSGNPGQSVSGTPINPPLITVYPTAVSNDEIPYVGGTVQATGATVVLYVENADTASTLSYAAVSDKNGQWFFAFPQFLDPGHYEVWTELKVGEVLSPPSARVDFTVQPSAVRFGNTRVSYETFYFVIALVLFFILVALIIFLIYHTVRARKKHGRFMEEVRNAEESIRRGFLIIRHDIEMQLDGIRKLKLNRELFEAEKAREEKLMNDLDAISRHVEEEVWDLGEKEKHGE